VVNVEKKDIVVSMAKCPKEEAEEPDIVNDELIEGSSSTTNEEE
jgi:hypothetical protein